MDIQEEYKKISQDLKDFDIAKKIIRRLDDIDAIYSLSDELIVRMETIQELKNKNQRIKKQFQDWMDEGNVITITDIIHAKYYETQDAQYRNKLKSKSELYNYFIKEFINV